MNIDRIRLGISACLLGQRVRFDSGHKREPFLVESLGQFVDWVPVCPEVESGMGAPRESMRLVRVDDEIRLLLCDAAQSFRTIIDGFEDCEPGSHQVPTDGVGHLAIVFDDEDAGRRALRLNSHLAYDLR